MPAVGKVSQVIGSTFDAEFPEDQLPRIYNAVKVKFNDIQPRAAVQQTLGQGTLARPDFHQMLAGTRINAPQDAMNHARIMQKILAERAKRNGGNHE